MADESFRFVATADDTQMVQALEQIRAGGERLTQQFATTGAAAQTFGGVLDRNGNELTRQEIAHQKLTASLGDLSTATDATATHAAALDTATAAVAEHLPKVAEAAETAGKRTETAFKGIETAAKAAWGAITGGLSVLADLGGAVLGNAEKTKKWQDTMDDTSALLGISRQSMVDWNYAAQQTPISTEQFTGALTHLGTQMRAADTGYDNQAGKIGTLKDKLTDLQAHIAATGDKHGTLHAQMVKVENQITALGEKTPRSAKAFADLGINVYDAHGAFRTIDSMLPDISAKFVAMADGPEKTALAMKLFGGSGAEMIEFLNKGPAALEAYRKHAEALGITITDKDITANNLLIESQQALKQAWEGIEHKLGQAIIPLLADLATKAVPLIEGALTWAGHLKDALAPGLERVGELIGQVLSAVSPLVDAFGLLLQGDFSGFGEKVGTAFHNVLNVIGDTISNLINGAPGWGTGLVVQFSNGIISGITSFLKPAIDSLGGFIQGMLEPHSPPPFLPHLDKWGADAAGVYLAGWKQADFSAFDSLASAIKDHLTTLLDTHAIGKLDLDPMLGAAREALQRAQDEFTRFGSVSSAAIDRLSATLGPGKQALLDYIQTTFQLESAHKATAEAQKHLTDLQETYKKQLDDVAEKIRVLALAERQALGSLPDQIQAAQDKITQLGRDSEAALHPLNVQLHDLGLQLKAAQDAGATALKPFLDSLDDAKNKLKGLQAQMAEALDPLKDNIRSAQQALQDLQNAGRDALAPFDDRLKEANADLQGLRDAAQQTMQGFADAAQPLQDALSALAQSSAAALAPIDAALSVAKARVEEFKLASKEIAASYDAQLAPLLAQLHAVQDVELKKKHAEELHNMGLAVENLSARLKNAVPGSAEYIEIQQELAKAQGDLADKTAEYSADDKIKALEKEKEEALKAAKVKEDAAGLDVASLEKQRAAVVATSEAQRKAIEGQLHDIQQEQQAFQRAEQQREQAAEHRIKGITAERQAVADKYAADITASQRAIEQQTRELQHQEQTWHTKIQAAQDDVALNEALTKSQQDQTTKIVDALQKQILPIQAKRDELAWTAQEQQRTAGLELATLQGQEQAITRRYAKERSELQDTAAAITVKQHADEAAATASLKAAKDFEDSLKAQADAQRALVSEQKNAAEILKAYEAALKAAKGTGQAWAGGLDDGKDKTKDLGTALVVAKDHMHNLDDAQAAAGKGALGAKQSFDTFLDGLRNKWNEVTGGIKAAIDDFTQRVKEHGLAGAIISEITDGWNLLSKWTQDLGKLALQWLLDVAPKLAQAATDAWNGITHFLTGPFFKDLVHAGGELLGAGLRWLNDLIATMPQRFTDITQSVIDWIASIGPKTKKGWQDIVQGIFDGIGELVQLPAKIKHWAEETVKTFLSGLMDGLGVKSPSTKMIEIAGHLIDGLVQGLDPAKLLAKIKDVAGSAIDSFKNILGIHSPSKETEDMGGYLLAGLTGGMDSGNSTLVASFARIQVTFGQFGTQWNAQTGALLGTLPPVWQAGLAGLLPVWDALFGPDAGLEGTLLNRLWGHGANSFFTVLVAYTKTKNEQWFHVTWVAALDELATKLTDYLRLKAAEVSVGGNEVGKHIILGIAQGINTHTHFVEEAAKHAVEAAIAAANRAAESKSPSERAAREVGGPLAQGVAKGINDHAGQAADAMRGVVKGAVGVGVPGGAGGLGVAGGTGTMYQINVNVAATGGPGGMVGPKGEPLFTIEWWYQQARNAHIGFQRYENTRGGN